MKKGIKIFICLIILCLCAAPAMAAMYTMDAWTAAQLRPTSYSDITNGSLNNLKYIGYNPGTLAVNHVLGDAPIYGAVMKHQVGFSGGLFDRDGDGNADVLLGALNGTNNVLDGIKVSGSWGGFYLPIANDNNQNWQYKLYATTETGSHETDWTTVAAGSQITPTLSFGGSSLNFSTLTDIGFGIRLNSTLIGGTASDDFHTSVVAVPVPAAFLLGLLGMGAAGIKLRKFA